MDSLSLLDFYNLTEIKILLLSYKHIVLGLHSSCSIDLCSIKSKSPKEGNARFRIFKISVAGSTSLHSLTSLAEQVKSITRKDSILQGAGSYPIPFKPRRLEIHSEIHSDDRTEDKCFPAEAGFPNA